MAWGAPLARKMKIVVCISLSRGFLFIFLAGENAIVIVGGANLALRPEEVQETRNLVATAKVVICQLEISPETTLAALKLAKELGGK
jgi:sugar/nucleoside kinase (ribokinase family)